MHNTSDINSFRYAQMQSSIHNKTSQSMSGVKSNLKAKFGYIQQTMDDIEAELRSLSIATKESLRMCDHLKVELGEKQLNEYYTHINEQVRKLDKAVKYGMSEANNRTQKLWSDCKDKINSTESLKQNMNNLNERINRLENTLGFFSVTETMN